MNTPTFHYKPGFIGWLRFVVTPNIYPARWQDRLMQGHIRWGPVVLYGANAMHWAINVKIGRNYWCAHPPTRTFGGKWPGYFYVSPDATPQKALFMAGRAE